MAQGTIYGTGLNDQTQFVYNEELGTTQIPECVNAKITDSVLNYRGCIPTMQQLQNSGRYQPVDDFADRKEMAKYCDFQCLLAQIPQCTKPIFNLEDLT